MRSAAEEAHAALLGESEGAERSDVVSLVAVARRALEHGRAHDSGLGELADRLTEVAALAADIGADLRGYADGIEADDQRMAWVQERRATLKGLTRKYGPSVDDVLAWAEAAERRVRLLDESEGRTEVLVAEQAQLREELGRQAALVSKARTAAATTFSAAVSAELRDLAMPHAVVSVDLRTTEDPGGISVGRRLLAFGPHGVDEIELLLAPHPGAPPRGLAKGASGGELSRVMLAVEVVFAGADPVPTFIFDEVDAGVGGKAAVEVGRRLARLARSSQVVVVTHLPQVAAFADLHLVVEKASDGAVTRSGVSVLDDAGRVRELTRMLAGLEESASGRLHATELLATAESAKSTG